MFSILREINISNGWTKEIMQLLNKQLLSTDIFEVGVIILIVSFHMFQKVWQPVVGVSTINISCVFQSTNYVQNVVLDLLVREVVLARNDNLWLNKKIKACFLW